MRLTLVSWILLVALGLYGLLFGSFANVVIWRVPRGESVVSPGSRCPSCGHAVRWYDNIPVLSWLLLRGRCRDCDAAISRRYPVVEALSGVLWVSAGLRFGLTWRTAACVVLFYLLLVLSFIDIDTYRLPNRLVAVLAGCGLAGAMLSQLSGAVAVPVIGFVHWGPFATPIGASFLGAALGAGFSGGIAALYGALRGRTGLGMGDVKLLGAMGLFTGGYVLMVLFAGSIVGAVWGVVGAARGGHDVAHHKIPFGPFLALGCVLTVLVGPAVWAWYASLVGLA